MNRFLFDIIFRKIFDYVFCLDVQKFNYYIKGNVYVLYMFVIYFFVYIVFQNSCIILYYYFKILLCYYKFLYILSGQCVVINCFFFKEVFIYFFGVCIIGNKI